MKDDITISWEKNAEEWIKVIDSGQIASREYTNKAIVELLEDCPSNKIIDIGCGEGWLTRKITAMGKKAVGIDVTEQLLVNARKKGSESYYCMSYDDIIEGEQIPNGPYNIAVFNFCLYQNKGLAELLKATKCLLSDNGSIVIQTLHPYFLFKNGLAYKSQVVNDSWKGLPGNFTDGHQWYARTYEDWVSVFSSSNMRILDLKEVLNEEQQPISLIIRVM